MASQIDLTKAKARKEMKRSEREIKNFTEIIDILNRADTIRLGINGCEYPYVVPLSFGFEVTDGQIILYFHGAVEGLKHELLSINPHVCVEVSIFHRFAGPPQYNALTTKYESLIGFGKAEIVKGATALKGLDLICEHCGYKGFDYGGEKILKSCRVYKVEISEWTGKRNL